MALESFRFLHTSDFHLDEAPGGFVELPDGLVEQLVDATYRAVDNVFDTALRERVDFVLLAGDIVHFPTASPRAIDFLSMQFERLHEERIPVYWLGGELEAGAGLPEDLRLPKNVYRLATSRVQTLEVKKQRRTIGYVVGQSTGEHGYANLQDMRVPRDGRFFVGMWYCPHQESLDATRLDELGVDYWALGGNHAQKTLSTVIPAQFCGTPQGRSPAESGVRGCLLVKVTGDQIDDSLLVETDTVRYRTERIDVVRDDDRQTLLGKMKSRLQTLRHEVDPQTPLLVTWEIVDDGPWGRQLRTPAGRDALMQDLQLETQAASVKNAWTIGLRSIRGAVPATLFDEDSLVGDFLRIVRGMEDSGVPVLDLQSYLPDTAIAEQIAEQLHALSPPARTQLLREVTAMGIDLLCGDAV